MKSLLTAIVAALILAGCGPKTPPIPMPQEPPPPPPVRAEKLDPALMAAARKELDAALMSREVVLRAHAIEAAQQTIKEAAKEYYLAGLNDIHPLVRFASAMAIGQLQIADARPQLEQMINDADQHVGIAVRFALHRLGDTRYSKDLQNTARSVETPLRANTAMVLGLLKEPSAAKILKPMEKDREPAVRLQAAEAMWRMGDADAVKVLIAASQSSFADEQTFAIMALAAPRDPRVKGHIRSALTAEHEEVRLQAARAMGLLGSDAGYAIAAAAVESRDPRQRAMAALALGAIGRTDAQGFLRKLLKDDDAEVRLCAAQAILQLAGTGRP